MSASKNKTVPLKAAKPGKGKSLRIKPEDIKFPEKHIDYGVWTGLGLLVFVLFIALTLSGSLAAFADLRAFLIVVCGTLAIMGLSFNGKTLRHSLKALKQHLFEKPETPHARALMLMDLAAIGRQDGVLVFQNMQPRLRRQDPFLAHGLEMLADGHSVEDIDRILNLEIDVELERLQGAIALLRRGAEAAPAMGLIGTLIGLVQMLSKLDDPATIGPAMAVALLTTFYGALMGSAFFAPLAGKLELQAQNLILRMELVVLTMKSIVIQENPRRLEQVLNSKLPAAERINYFEGV